MNKFYRVSKVITVSLLLVTLTTQVAIGAITHSNGPTEHLSNQFYPKNPTTGADETWTYHDHTYYNETVENNSKIYRSLIREFRLYLNKDILANVDVQKIICAGTKTSVLPDNQKFQSCNTYYSTIDQKDDPNYYGMKVTLTDNNAGSVSQEEREYDAAAPSSTEFPKMIRWQFAMDYAEGSPGKANHYQAMLAASETLDTLACAISNTKPTSNTADQIAVYAKICANKTADFNNRGFFEHDADHHLIELLSNDMSPLKKWSATSISKILIADQYIKVPTNTNGWDPLFDNKSIWMPIMARTTPSGKEFAWKWVNIGKDITTWVIPTTVPPGPSSNFCASLNITHDTLYKNTPVKFNVTPVFGDNSGNPNDLQFTWTANNGSFNPASPTKSKSVTFSGGPAGTTITVTTKDGFQNYPGCTGTFIITDQSPPCPPGNPNNNPNCQPPCPPGNPYNNPNCGKPPVDCIAIKGGPLDNPYDCPNNYIEKRIEGQKIINISRTGTGFTKVKYQILYTPTYPGPHSYTEITDSIWGGKKIVGSKGGTVTLADDTPKFTEINPNTGTAYMLDACVGNIPDFWKAPCYKNNMKGGGKVSIYGAQYPVLITYWGNVKSVFSCLKADPKSGCAEEFNNTAQYTSWATAAKLAVPPVISGTSSAKILAVCPYILTRAGGDVLFQSPLQTALIDINACVSVKSSDDIVITPTEIPTIINKTGGSAGFDISHKVCENSNSSQKYGNLEDGSKNPLNDYANPLANISSLLCEFKLPLGDKLKSSAIEKSIEDSKLRASRWNVWNGSTNFDGYIPQGQDVFRLPAGKKLTIGNINTIAFGAKVRPVTFITENADIEIIGNINTSDDAILGNQGTIALIALNGNIIIDNKAKNGQALDTVSAVLYAQKGANTSAGKIKGSSGESDSILTIIGSVYGDIEDIVSARKPTGAILNLGKDQSAFTVRYDERIFFSTPPVLQDLVDISQSDVVR